MSDVMRLNPFSQSITSSSTCPVFCSRTSPPCRRLPASPQEVWRCRSCTPESCPGVGGDSGEAGQWAAGFGSAPPRRLCSASEVKWNIFRQQFVQNINWGINFFFFLAPQARYTVRCWNMAKELQKDCKLQSLLRFEKNEKFKWLLMHVLCYFFFVSLKWNICYIQCW